jgi:predicted HTH domain antitoxin
MKVILDIPDSLADRIQATGKDLSGAVLEALLVDAYRARQLSESQIKRILGFGTRMQVHTLLSEHNVPLNYGVDELNQDIETIRRMEAQSMSSAA